MYGEKSGSSLFSFFYEYNLGFIVLLVMVWFVVGFGLVKLIKNDAIVVFVFFIICYDKIYNFYIGKY